MEFSGDLRKNLPQHYFIVFLFILSAERRQSFPVNIQPTVSLALMKTENKSNTSFTKIPKYISVFFQWLDARHRRGQCLAGVFGCRESKDLPVPSRAAQFILLPEHIHAYSSVLCLVLLPSR